MNWLALLQAVLSIAIWIGRQLSEDQVRKAFGDALIVEFDKRADAAVAAHDDVISGRVPIDGNDPNRRE